ncbi:HesA/MoeB/ThiF family protein [Nocardioides astragali]|uniref:HesA/MoeB/ThiF family protein n=1 Tax=Nocardioides astragali TaxID=1776736 RepID=A0ABW2N177_9ACTN|nr:ThiF family adenylyltransferase [Nocardioides astragali]
MSRMSRPRLKPPHQPLARPNGTLWIGSLQYGLGCEVDDASGLVQRCCRLMDGSRSVDDVVRELVRGTSWSSDDGVRVVEFLVESGWVEDAAGARPAVLSERELERYSRSADLLAWMDLTPRPSRFELQARLKQSRVTILGVGGIGSAVATGLAASGVGQLHCVDGDIVELSNLNRQVLFDERDLGRPKVDAAVDRLRAMNSDIEVTGSHGMITSEAEIEDAVRGSDVFVHAIDKPVGVQDWSNSVAWRLGIPWSSASYNGPMMTAVLFIPGVTGCRSCMLEAQVERLRAAGDEDLLQHGPLADFNPVMAATAQISGHFGAFEIIKYLTGLPVQTAGRQLHRSFVDFDHHYYTEAPRRADCLVCSDALVPVS